MQCILTVAADIGRAATIHARNWRVVHATAPVVSFAFLYFLAGKIGLQFATVHENVSLIWPAAGFAVGGLLLFGYRLWPGVAAGAFLVHASTEVPLSAAGAIAIGNTLEALCAAFLLRQFCDFHDALDRLTDVFNFIVYGCIASSAVGATIGVASLTLGGSSLSSNFALVWLSWWIGDLVGILIVAPLLLSWVRYRTALEAEPCTIAEGALIIAALGLTATVIFGAWFTRAQVSYPLLYALFPFIIWATIRFRQIGATTTTFMASAIAIGATVGGMGPFERPTVEESVVLLEAFMSVLAVTSLVLAATISERKKAERRLAELNRNLKRLVAEKTERLQKSERLAAMGFAAGRIIHEVSNPVHGIYTSIQVLQRGMSDEDDRSARGEEMAALITDLAAETDRLISLIDEFRTLSNAPAYRFGSTDLSQVASEVLHLQAPRYSELGIRVRQDFPPNLPLIRADRSRIKQVLLNLCKNAVEAMPEGGTLTLRADVRGDRVNLEVIDTGHGISPEVNVFDLYSSKPTGMGLGLAIAEQIVSAHDGTIAYESERGKGTIFRITLPVGFQEESGKEEAKNSAPNF